MTDIEFDRYILLYRKSVRNAALCILRNADDAEDITQEVFLKLYTYEGMFRGDDHIKAWLLRTSANMSIDLLRSNGRRRTVPLSSVGEQAAPESSDSALMPAIMRLSPKLRTALYLHYYEGYSVEDTARILKISKAAVKWRLGSGRKQLKTLIEGGYDNEL